MTTTITLPTKNTRRVIVYAGRHYGRIHTVVQMEGRNLTCRHEDSGDMVTVHITDTEVA